MPVGLTHTAEAFPRFFRFYRVNFSLFRRGEKAPGGTPSGVTGTITLNADFTVPAGVTLTVPPGWTLNLNGKTLTNSGTINLGGVPIAGTGTITGSGTVN